MAAFTFNTVPSIVFGPVGIPADAVPMLAEDALRQTRLLVNNPRPLALADARAIYEAAW
jgi:alcohol dehydrogenase class IV